MHLGKGVCIPACTWAGGVKGSLADTRGRQGGTSLGGPNSFISMQFSAKKLQNDSVDWLVFLFMIM